MLKEIGIATPILVILVIVVLIFVLSQTTEFGVFSSGSLGVTEETALTWGENGGTTETIEDSSNEIEATPEVETPTEEAVDS